jgi:NAD(P)-dependent dehydrogenase (short-subunit alcohol dehydrogenase family)
MGWDIAGARVLITGGTSGIGRAAAAELTRRGAEVMITARDQAKGQAAAQAIRAETGVDVQVGLLDLSRLDSVRDFAADYTRTHDRLDVLVNNAGTMTGKRMQTPDGLEWTFGVNHLAPFLLTRLLSDLLVASAPSRVISVSSEIHRSAKQGLDLDDLQMTRGWSAQKAYAASKLATILMTVELDQRLAHQGVTALAVHPGVVATNFGKGPEGRWLMRVMMTALGPLLKKPTDGAAPLVLLATAPDDVVDQSLYWSQATPAQPSPAARDPRAAAQTWDISDRLAGLA